MYMNALQFEKSPYLFQHAGNPVNWRPWGKEAFDAAREIPEELRDYLRRGHPNLTVLVKTPESAQTLARIAPFTADYPLPETGATYYLCHDGRCEAPVEELEGLRYATK